MDNFDPVTPQEYQRLMQILSQNKDKSFVQRILRPNDFPQLDLGNGSYATHQMEWSQVGDKYVVHPRVLLEDGGKLKDYGDNAWDQVKQTGNYIEFDNPKDAEWFSSRYKGAWGGQMNRPPK